MICPKCHGLRGIWARVVGSTATIVEACEYCYGEGNIHCCEGDQEQPDPNREETVYYRREEW